MSIRNKLFLSHLFLVIFNAATIGFYFYNAAADSLMNSLKERLQASAALISPMIDADEIRHIRDEKDISRSEYRDCLVKLRTLRRMNPDIAFLYWLLPFKYLKPRADGFEAVAEGLRGGNEAKNNFSQIGMSRL